MLSLATALSMLGIPATTYQVTAGSAFDDRWYPHTDVSIPLIIQETAGMDRGWLQACLMRAYPAAHRLHWLDPGTEPPHHVDLSLEQLDGALEPAAHWWLVVPPLPKDASVLTLANIVARLRAPDGCPWDREQTLESLRNALLSEVHEVLEAIDLQDHANLREELGDLMLDAIFLVNIAVDDGLFQLADVMTEICQKMIRRHPHVYGTADLGDSSAVLMEWDQIKKAEYAAKGKVRKILDGVPAALPALEAARQIQGKADKAGMDLDPVLPDRESSSSQELAEGELARRLWDLVALARRHDLIPEDALRSLNSRCRSHIQALEMAESAG